MTAHSLLGDYLSARRALVRPDDVGLPALGRRRVEGLRREEVAMLAGISADYYLRLEQGRDHNPSAPVLESLARVLLLDETATAYLLALVAPRPRNRAVRRGPRVPDGILGLVASIGLPAHVESRHLDVLAANDLARAVNPNLHVGGNRLRAMFLDPAEQALCPGFEDAMAFMVASFRQSIGPDAHDPRSVRLVGELSIASDDFRRLWARHDVHVREGGVAVMPHPQVGDLTLSKERLAVAGDDGLTLVVYHPAPGTRTSEKLSLLASLSADRPPAVRA
ncbi:helix-turn-helix domain-containing protein [Aeromicrobium sp. Root472D3]|uniref:helix-turn-helix domain-containing protein n=1 Tax=Aeromicrobium sp. Root472D3 TaxID=1736540 RepID=UPI000701EE09|nr:helix-turn-helix transcriptional regulator [Aeromicrobium sp. Root472D3]KQX75084.1 XRE family transcriptional regulator [Aeromicrobium sp. Root472D3]